jgi:hypothetical protein
MISIDPNLWIIFIVGLLIGWGLNFISSLLVDVDSRLQDLQIKTKRITEEEAYAKTSKDHQILQVAFGVVGLVILLFFVVTILLFAKTTLIVTTQIPTYVSVSTTPSNLMETIIISVIIGIITGILTGVTSTYLTANFVTRYQQAYTINGDLKKCLNEIIDNKKKLSTEQICRQLQNVRDAATFKREKALTDRNLAINKWAAFEKKELPFSYTNYFQYLLVDNTDYFLRVHAHHYPIKSDELQQKFRDVLELLKISIEFNSELQNFENKLRNNLNRLIEDNDLDKTSFDLITELNIKEVNEFCQITIKKFDEIYSRMDAENISKLEINVGFFDKK